LVTNPLNTLQVDGTLPDLASTQPSRPQTHQSVFSMRRSQVSCALSIPTIQVKAVPVGHTLSIDFFGPIGGFYGFSAMDVGSRYIWIRVTSGTTADDAAKALMSVIADYGFLTRIFSDNGPAFISNVFQRLVARFGVVHHFAPALHPRANGRLERVHAAINNALRIYAIHHNPEHWAEYLLVIEMVLRGSPIGDSCYAPSVLYRGRLPMWPLEALMAPWDAKGYILPTLGGSQR
jgi:transposase InsO family protein